MPGFSSTGQTAITYTGVFDQDFETTRRNEEITVF